MSTDTTPAIWQTLIVVVTAFVLAAARPSGASAQAAGEADRATISDAQRAALAGPWRGVWTGGDFVYGAEMKLTIAPTGEANGAITWTLRKSPRADEEHKIGLTGVEHVRGRYHVATGFLVLDGHAADDPNRILGLDRYRLAVGDTHATMGGITWHHGRWDGRFHLSR